ncbi:MAG: tetratricopeptide repeat protein [Chloroflexaceae bacterium]|nr:tetratricopeptide repeat protein [Chloroflexaceae bacterium]
MNKRHNRSEALRHLQLGMALERANRFDEAVAHYRQAIAADPLQPEAHNALGFYYQRAGLFAKAVEEFRQVASLEGSFLAYFNLGYVLVELERYDEALDAFEHCLKLAPDDPAAHFELALIHLARNDYARALAHLDLPLQNYPQDWEVHNLHGRCLLGLRRYDEATAAFGRALLLAHSPAAMAEVVDNLNSVERHREFRSLANIKDQLYAEDGVIYLGSTGDDGLQLRETQDYHFSYSNIGTTLQRLIALVASTDWRFSAVVAADGLARPLAVALAELLPIPLRSAEELTAADRALLVFAVAREVELLLLSVERLPCAVTAFCLGLNWTRHTRVLPDVVGIAARGACSVPWEATLRRLRAEGAPQSAIAACVAEAAAAIITAVRETPLDTNLPRQIRYYTRTHRRVNIGNR